MKKRELRALKENPREIDFAEKTESKEEKSTTPQI